MELEGFSFTLPEQEAAAVYMLLTAAGFPANSQGLKEYLRRQAGITTGAYDDVGAEHAEAHGEEDLSEKVRRIIEVAEANPEITGYAIKKGAELFGSLLKRLK